MFVPDNTLASALAYLKDRLSLKFTSSEVRQIQRLFFEIEFQLNPSELILVKEKRFSESELLKIRAFVHRLLNNEPLQYILGQSEFCGFLFKTDNRALIPRPETEELVHKIVEKLRNFENPQILDFCTGSGCIALSLKKLLPDSQVFASDLSEAALSLAIENAKELNAAVHFFKQDALALKTTNATMQQTWDLIVSNPPYIPEQEKSEMQETVLRHEPEMALFVPDHNPLVFYESIAEYAKKQLKAGGLLAFEIHENKAHELRKLLADMEFGRIEFFQDLQGKSRMVFAQK